MQEEVPAHNLSSTVLLDLCRQSLQEFKEEGEEEGEVQMLAERRP